MRRRAVLLLPFAALPCAADDLAPWPEPGLRMVVAYPPGGVSDEITRVLAHKLAARLGVPVQVEHRPGAGGAVAMRMLSRAAPDGRTLCFSAITALTLVPHVAAVSYDPLRDIAPVAGVMHTPVLVVGTPALPARSYTQMLEAARSRPSALRWATSGVGTTGHLVLEQVRRATGVEIVHIPYKGGAQQLNDALAGQFELLSTNVGPLQLQYVAQGRLAALAVGSPMRLGVLPGVPTLAEAGAERANLVSLFGVFAPAATPPPVIARLNAEINAALREKDLRDRLAASSNEPAGGTAAQLARRIEREWAANRHLLR
jgi:tripartite-type tricarboxylate transporter receptor subunit TctC